MKNLILVKVPNDSDDYYINSVGCLRYSRMEGRKSECIEPMESGVYLEKEKHKIIGVSMFMESKIVVIEI